MASVIIHERAKAVAEILLEFHLIRIGDIGKRENVIFKLNMLKVAWTFNLKGRRVWFEFFKYRECARSSYERAQDICICKVWRATCPAEISVISERKYTWKMVINARKSCKLIWILRFGIFFNLILEQFLAKAIEFCNEIINNIWKAQTIWPFSRSYHEAYSGRRRAVRLIASGKLMTVYLLQRIQ